MGPLKKKPFKNLQKNMLPLSIQLSNFNTQKLSYSFGYHKKNVICLNIKSLSFKENFVNLICGGTFGAEPHKKWNIMEAPLILESNDNCIIKITELISTCRHLSKFLLKNWRSAVT